ncbi:MAG: hypothetical protein LBI36_06870 [Oscillospiraceae bacterium]|nr:hypothetical protein [Oscillospiraceae bacterium]
MAVCDKCGKYMDDGETVCRSCGSAAKGAANFGNFDFNKTFNDFMNTSDSTGEFDESDVKGNYGAAVLAYLPLLFVITLLVASGSKFAKFHANQGIVLFIFEIVLGAAVGVVKIVFGVVPGIGGMLAWIVGVVAGLFTFLLIAAGVINAANGRAKRLPVIGGIDILS